MYLSGAYTAAGDWSPRHATPDAPTGVRARPQRGYLVNRAAVCATISTVPAMDSQASVKRQPSDQVFFYNPCMVIRAVTGLDVDAEELRRYLRRLSSAAPRS
jgi:hypothetical protein